MTNDITTKPITHEVDPARLESGNCLPPPPSGGCHRANKTIGQSLPPARTGGDISASYSADRIGMSQPVRKPFSWQGSLWVCVGMSHLGGVTTAEAYRLVHPQVFDGEPLSYSAKTANSEAARADPNGF
jgi:hypothetical protein